MLSGGYISAPKNNTEYTILILVNLFGAFLWAMVQGVVCAVLSTGNPLETEYKNNLDALNFLMRDMSLPSDLRQRMRAYMRSTKDTKKRSGYASLVKHNFSTELQEEIRFEMAGHLLEKTPVFAPIVKGHGSEGFENSKQFFEKLSPHMERRAFAPDEIVTGSASGIFIISSGVVAQSGDILIKGRSFGHDCIISSPALRDQRAVRCLSYVEVAMCKRDAIFEVLEDPAFAKIKEHVLHMALLKATGRAIALCALYKQLVEARSEALTQKRRSSLGGGQQLPAPSRNSSSNLSEDSSFDEIESSFTILGKAGVASADQHEIKSLSEALEALHPIIAHKARRDGEPVAWRPLNKRDATEEEVERFPKQEGTGRNNPIRMNASSELLVTEKMVESVERDTKDPGKSKFVFAKHDQEDLQKQVIYSIGQGIVKRDSMLSQLSA